VENCFSVDVEDYFHCEAFARRIDPDQWPSRELRVERNANRLLQFFDERHCQITWFVLGWVAERCPQLVKAIASAGHEIASHGHNHRHLKQMTPKTLAQDVRHSIRLLEDLTGTPVAGYRAPTFSITRSTAWAIDVLRNAGLSYDSSIYPVRHDRYGVPGAPMEPFDPSSEGDGTLVEFPPLVGRRFGMNLPMGGGGSLRLLPINWMSQAISQANRTGRPAMIYVHPWEIDPDQPRLPCGPITRIRHYRNLDKTLDRLGFLFDQHTFTTAKRLLESYRNSPSLQRWPLRSNEDL